MEENKMGRDSILKLIITMSLPSMFSMLVQALYNIVDSYFVAQISENALTAVSLAFPIQMLMSSVGVGTSVGLNSFVSRMLGAKRNDLASRAATQGIFLAVVSWAVFALVGGLFARPFFEAFTDIEEIIEMGTQYIMICSIFCFGIFVEMMLSRILMATGNMIYPMWFQLLGAISNIVLDPIFIFGWFGMPQMGIAGAALATVLGQIFSMIFAVIVLAVKKLEVTISFKKFRPEGDIIKKIYAVGLPSIVMQSVGSVMNVLMNALLITFTETAVAVFGVYFKLQSFVFMPVFGLTHGVMPLIGYNYGARNKERVMKSLRYGCLIALIINTIGMIIFWVFPSELLDIFNASDVMKQIGIPSLQIISLCFIPAALGILTGTLFQAVGKGSYSLIISLLRQLVILVPAAYLLALMGDVTLVWYSFPIAEVFSLAASLIMTWYLYKKNISRLDDKDFEIVK